MIDIEREAGLSIGQPSTINHSKIQAPLASPISQTSTLAEHEDDAPSKVSVWTRIVGRLRISCNELSHLIRRHDDPPMEATVANRPGPENNLITRQVEEQPNGFPQLATLLDADENFMIYRRFGNLGARLLLEKQDELRELEGKLDREDKKAWKSDEDVFKYRTEAETESHKLLVQIEKKWLEYSSLLQASKHMVGMNRPTPGEHRSVSDWISHAQPVVSHSARFIRCREDLVTLRPGREHAWLDSLVETCLNKTDWSPLNNLFRSKETQAKSNGAFGVMLYTRAHIDKFVVCIIMMMILVLLVVPIYALYKVSGKENVGGSTPADTIGILLVSTLAFSACISLFTRAKRHEVLAASAAYCAVLVVFIGNLADGAAGSVLGAAGQHASHFISNK